MIFLVQVFPYSGAIHVREYSNNTRQFVGRGSTMGHKNFFAFETLTLMLLNVKSHLLESNINIRLLNKNLQSFNKVPLCKLPQLSFEWLLTKLIMHKTKKRSRQGSNLQSSAP